MSELLQILPVPKQSLMQRIFRQFPFETPFIELNNLLATKGWMNVTEDDINVLQIKYKLDIRQTFSLNLTEYCITYFNNCLSREGSLSLEAQETIAHMKSLFKINEGTFVNLQRKLGEPLYRKKFQVALRDGYVNEKEDDRLNKLAYSLMLPQEITKNIRLELTQRHFDNYVSKKLKLRALSPEEDEELDKMATRLGMKPILEKETNRLWQKARRMWDLENLELPVIQTIEFHQRTENCFFIASRVEWHEQRIQKGTPYLKHLDTGDLILTDQRLIYNGKSKVTHLKFSDIQDFIRQGDYLEVRKHSGRNPTMVLSEIDELTIVLGRLLPG